MRHNVGSRSVKFSGSSVCRRLTAGMSDSLDPSTKPIIPRLLSPFRKGATRPYSPVLSIPTCRTGCVIRSVDGTLRKCFRGCCQDGWHMHTRILVSWFLLEYSLLYCAHCITGGAPLAGFSPRAHVCSVASGRTLTLWNITPVARLLGKYGTTSG